MAYSITPSGNRLLLEKVELKPRIGSMLRPDSMKDGPRVAKVLAVGPGNFNMITMSYLPMTHSVGQLVYYPPTGGWKVELDGKEYILIEDHLILGVVEEKSE